MRFLYPLFKGTALRHPLVVLAILAALSAPLRLIYLQQPLTGEHNFRQTQTALSVWEIREHGFSLLHPKLPLFGPPWECPLEYPVFQLGAAMLDSIAPWTDLDLSIRVTNLAFYYLTALALYLLARLLFAGAGAALFTTAVFLFSAYNVFWSSASMIEYAATFFGLAYLISVIRWSLDPGKAVFVLGLLFGILGCLTKATTFVIPLLSAGTLASLQVLRLLRAKSTSDNAHAGLGHRITEDANTIPPAKVRMVLRIGHIVAFGALLIVPLFVGWLYIKYGDAIKERSPYTAWLSSSHPYTKGWNYGTWQQRLRWGSWNLILNRMQHTSLPFPALAMVLGFCALPFRARRFEGLPYGNFWIGCSLSLAPLLAILLFFNLYVVHTYYLIACAPLLALYTGVGLSLVFNMLRTKFLKVIFLLLLLGLWLQEWSPQLGALLGSPPGGDRNVNYLVEAAKLIKKEDPVIIVSSTEWSSFAPYYLKRRAFMAMLLNKPVNIRPLLDEGYFKKNGFHWLLVEGNANGMPEFTAQITNHWKSVRAVPVSVTNAAYVLYSLSDE
jgi:4-amino-4-deoxy-L-arabinose transferase-like glycosyltransferase